MTSFGRALIVPSTMIQAKALSKRFGDFVAVDSIDIEVGQGQVVGFLGPNGAGKSTTLRMIAGYLPPTSGEITVAGHDVRRQSLLARAAIGYLPESTPLYPEMRVVEYLRFRAKLFGLPRRDRNAAIDMVIRQCWLNQARRKPIGHLSKGYRQRVGLAAALLHRPPVLLLDEPTSGLDPSQIREMRKLIRDLAGQHTVFLSTHILPEVEMTCDSVVMIASGKIRAQGTFEELRRTAAKQDSYVVETTIKDAAERIATIEGAVDVRCKRLDATWRELTIHAGRGIGDLREAIAYNLSHNGGLVRELRRETPTLEQVFMAMTAGDSDQSVETEAAEDQHS